MAQYDILNSQKVKPFLKWAGGKAQLLKKFERFFPAELDEGHIDNYYEPFVGSGAVFFHLISKYHFKNVNLYDINGELINIYKVIQNYCFELIEELSSLQSGYFSKNKEERETYYYKIRSKVNELIRSDNFSKKMSIEKASKFIFLNRTCYNGLFRLNSKGEFNVPFGRYANPQILNESNLLKVNKALKNVTIKKSYFSDALKNVKKNSFVYLDPPYLPISKTSGFTSYSKEIFDKSEQVKLSEHFLKLSGKKNVWLMLSNSDPQNADPSNNFFQKHYSSPGKRIQINKVDARRMINCMADKRGAIKELVITNYPSR